MARAPASTARARRRRSRTCEALFADDLDGHRLLDEPLDLAHASRPCERERWHDGNVVLVGDAAHTAHFSIGSGTKLAMEDAIALARRVRGARHGRRAARRSRAYEASARPSVERLQRAAQTSLEWFENAARYARRSDPLQFTFNLMTRSKRITYDNLRDARPRARRARDRAVRGANRRDAIAPAPATRRRDGAAPMRSRRSSSRSGCAG